jgi:hypothetical protein
MSRLVLSKINGNSNPSLPVAQREGFLFGYVHKAQCGGESADAYHFEVLVFLPITADLSRRAVDHPIPRDHPMVDDEQTAIHTK